MQRRLCRYSSRRTCIVLILPALLVLLLAACAGAPTVSSYNLVTPPPRHYELGAAIGGRAVPVAVDSSPFPGVSPAALAARLTDSMPGLCGAHYVPADSIAGTGIAWSFAATDAALQADVQLLAPPRGRLSEIQGSVAAPRDAQDPAFAALVRQMTMMLLQPCL